MKKLRMGSYAQWRHSKIFKIIISKCKKSYFIGIIFLLISSVCMCLNPIITVQIVDNAIVYKDFVMLLQLIIASLILYLLQYFFKYRSNNIFIEMGAELCGYLRKLLINNIKNQDGRFYSEANSGDLLTCILDDVNATKGLLSQSLFWALSDLVIYIPVSILILKMQPVLFICTLLMQPLLGYVSKIYNQKIYKRSREAKLMSVEQNSFMQEFLSNLLPIALIGGMEFYSNRLYVSIDKNKECTKNLEVDVNKRNNVMNFLAGIIITVTLGLCGLNVIWGVITMGQLMVFVQYSGQLFRPIISISECISQYKKVKISIDRIESMLSLQIKETESDIVDIQSIDKLELVDVSFKYNEKKKGLSNVNMTFLPNKIIAIVGDSGAGKSTIVNLLLHLWDVETGSINLNGFNINKFSESQLYGMISVVSQNTILFNGNIMDNILMGSNDSTAVIEACKMAEIYDFINSLPEKFNTNIGDKGVKLSGGQRQRIEIARALVKNKPIMIFDEATSALDSVNEKKIFHNIQNNLENKLVIVITHRLAMLGEADYIYILKDGAIVGEGKHEELIESNKEYIDLYSAANNH